jgi:hypothetical protein
MERDTTIQEILLIHEVMMMMIFKQFLIRIGGTPDTMKCESLL